MSATIRPLDGRRVLVVEDEYIIAMEIKRWLQRAGAEVVGRLRAWNGLSI